MRKIILWNLDLEEELEEFNTREFGDVFGFNDDEIDDSSDPIDDDPDFDIDLDDDFWDEEEDLSDPYLELEDLALSGLVDD